MCCATDVLRSKLYVLSIDASHSWLFVASECFYHLAGGKEAGFKPMHIKHEGVSHWWVQGPKGEVIDITAAQFKTAVIYENSRGKGFLTRNPSKRAQRLIDLVNSERNRAVSC